MVQKIISQSKNLLDSGRKRAGNFFYSKQADIFSAAGVIMVTVAIARVLGLIRIRTLFHFFPSDQVTLYLAAFKVPDFWFEVLMLSSLSTAFIPVFSSYLGKNKEKEAWQLVSVVLTFLTMLFLVFSLIIIFFAEPIYRIVAAGLPPEDIKLVADFSRLVLIGQASFLLSYILTGVLESNQRFLAPALAPAFYNGGIILGTILLAPTFGLRGAVYGAIIGAFLHLLIQLPLALKLGFRPRFSFNFSHPGLRKIVELSWPRITELSVFQARGFTDLYLASHISKSAYSLLRSADMMQGSLVGLFGLAIAKAALPTLSRQAAQENLESFKRTFVASFNGIVFLTVPVAVFVSVLRIPIVRLAFGAEQFNWPDTVETGLTLSAFSFAIVAYALVLITNRAFYALHETLLPMKVTIGVTLINVLLSFFFVFSMRASTWGLALSFSISSLIQELILLFYLNRKISLDKNALLSSFSKIALASSVSGTVMFFLLKIFDRSAWDKKLSFLSSLGLGLPTTFERFILDTRYTVNLVVLTIAVATIGAAIYLLMVWALRVREFTLIANVISRFYNRILEKTFRRQNEAVAVSPTDDSNPLS